MRLASVVRRSLRAARRFARDTPPGYPKQRSKESRPRRGFRLFGMDIDTSLNSASNAVQDRGTSESVSWVDPLVAARVIAPLGDKWFVTAYADAGGFITQSSSTWQAVGTFGYRFNERWSAQFGYRYMNLEKEVNGRDVTVDLYGPIIGASISF